MSLEGTILLIEENMRLRELLRSIIQQIMAMPDRFILTNIVNQAQQELDRDE